MFSEGFPSFQNQLFFFFEKHNASNYLFSHHFQYRNEWFDYCNLAIRLLSPSFVFLQALMSRAQQKPPREQQHSGLYNVLLLPPWLHTFSSLTNSFLPVFLFIFTLFFCAAYSFIFISLFNLLSSSSMLDVPSKRSSSYTAEPAIS